MQCIFNVAGYTVIFAPQCVLFRLKGVISFAAACWCHVISDYSNNNTNNCNLPLHFVFFLADIEVRFNCTAPAVTAVVLVVAAYFRACFKVLIDFWFSIRFMVCLWNETISTIWRIEFIFLSFLLFFSTSFFFLSASTFSQKSCFCCCWARRGLPKALSWKSNWKLFLFQSRRRERVQ